MSTKPRNERLKLVAAAALGLEALVFLVAAVASLAVAGWDSGIFVPLVAICVLVALGWVGLRWPGRASGCLLPFALIGFLFVLLGAAFSGGSLLGFLLLQLFAAFIPLIAGVLFLIAGRKRQAELVTSERPS